MYLNRLAAPGSLAGAFVGADIDRLLRGASVRGKSWTVEGLVQVKQAPMSWKDQGRFPRSGHR